MTIFSTRSSIDVPPPPSPLARDLSSSSLSLLDICYPVKSMSLRRVHVFLRAVEADRLQKTQSIIATKTTTSTFATKSPASPALTEEEEEEKEQRAARAWMTTFTPESIPKSICEVSFSRSSGPGGQNVNK